MGLVKLQKQIVKSQLKIITKGRKSKVLITLVWVYRNVKYPDGSLDKLFSKFIKKHK